MVVSISHTRSPFLLSLKKGMHGFYDDLVVTSGGVLTDVTADLNAGTNSAAFGFNVL